MKSVYSEIDRKVSFCRIRRSPLRKCYEDDYWNHLKDCVTKSQKIEWPTFVKRFMMTSLRCHQNDKPDSVKKHMMLKSLFAFFQQGYLIRDKDYVGLFFRSAHDHRITSGSSLIVSGRSHSLMDHSGGISKLCQKLALENTQFEIHPWAVGFTELARDGDHYSPAYFWLINEVKTDIKLSKSKPFSNIKDCFVGMKKVDRIFNRTVRVNGAPVHISGKFDQVVLDFIKSGSCPVDDKHSAIRLLRNDETQSIPADLFESRTVDLNSKSAFIKMIQTIGGIHQIQNLQKELAEILASIQDFAKDLT